MLLCRLPWIREYAWHNTLLTPKVFVIVFVHEFWWILFNVATLVLFLGLFHYGHSSHTPADHLFFNLRRWWSYRMSGFLVLYFPCPPKLGWLGLRTFILPM